MLGLEQLGGWSNLLPHRKLAKPTIEWLETRACPAVCIWDGSDNTDWADTDNWNGLTVPGANDTALLVALGVGASAPKITVDTTIGALIADIDFNRDLDIDNCVVTVKDGSWDCNQDIKGTGLLYLRTSDFIWTKGDIAVNELYIGQDGQLVARKFADEFTSPNVHIGKKPDGTDSPGTMIVSSIQAGDQLTGHLQPGDNQAITISANGTLLFLQTANADDQGGFATIAGVQSHIANYGQVLFRNAGADYLNLGVTFHSSGYVEFSEDAGTEAKVFINPPDTNAYDFSSDGTIQFFAKSDLKVKGGILADGGTWTFFDGGPGGEFELRSVNADIDFSDMTFAFRDDNVGRLIVSAVADDVTFTSCDLRFNTFANDGDKLAVTGDFALFGTGNVTTVTAHANPAVGAYDLITCTGTGTGAFATVGLDTELAGWTLEPQWGDKRYRLHN